jgi:integrase/recombinase XerD
MKSKKNVKALSTSISLTHSQMETAKREAIWKKLANISLESSATEWLAHLLPTTRKNYLSGIRMLSLFGIFDLKQSLQSFSLVNHDTVLDKIATIKQWSACSKQARAALYISLTRFLHRKTEGIIKRALSRKSEANRTFFRVRDKVKTEPLNTTEWTNLIKAMETFNQRDALIAKLCLQGARRIQEVLRVEINHINFANRQILFCLSKTRGNIKNVIVTIPIGFLIELKSYIKDRTHGLVFITAKEKMVGYTQIVKSLKKAAIMSKIEKKIHTHVLRTSAITHLRSLGFQDFEIQRLTGHNSSQMLNAYDKSPLEDNVSKKVSLI